MPSSTPAPRRCSRALASEGAQRVAATTAATATSARAPGPPLLAGQRLNARCVAVDEAKQRSAASVLTHGRGEAGERADAAARAGLRRRPRQHPLPAQPRPPPTEAQPEREVLLINLIFHGAGGCSRSWRAGNGTRRGTMPLKKDRCPTQRAALPPARTVRFAPGLPAPTGCRNTGR